MKNSIKARHRLILASLGFVCASAFAVSPSQEQCEADGGTWDRVNGTVICEYPPVEENVGNAPEHSNSQTTETTTTTTGQGNSGNKPTNDDECTGPKGQCK